MKNLERVAVNFVARTSPWVTPVPTAYLVGRATLIHLKWPEPIAVIAAIIVECLGISAMATALELYQYNSAKNKSNPAAPTWMAMIIVGLYFVVATGLTVLMDLELDLVRFSPALFPVLSLAGIGVIALRFDHQNRIAAAREEKEERFRARTEKKQAPAPVARVATKPDPIKKVQRDLVNSLQMNLF